MKHYPTTVTREELAKEYSSDDAIDAILAVAGKHAARVALPARLVTFLEGDEVAVNVLHSNVLHPTIYIED